MCRDAIKTDIEILKNRKRNVPWSGYDQSNVERQHMTRKRDIVINLQNVPLILRSLLEAGLHPDETMIMLDMDRVGKKLHRLMHRYNFTYNFFPCFKMIYEEEEKNDTFINETRNNNNNNDLLYNDTLYQKTSSTSPTQNKVTKKSFTEQSCQLMTEKKSTSNQLVKSKKEQCNGDLDSKNNTKKITVINDSVTIEGKIFSLGATPPCLVQPFLIHLQVRTNPKATSSLLSQERSPDYVRCKPANHTTAMEPKCNKSPSEYGGAISKLSTPRRKTPYTSMPPSIKHAIIQPQVLHSDAKSFYESTLWRKEKEICLSRMGRNSKEHNEDSLLSQQTICNTSITDDDKVQYSTPHVKNADATYIIEKDNYIEDNKESLKNISDSTSSTPNQSIQNMKDALDRATNIISLTTPSKISKLNLSNIQECKTVFENLYGTSYNDNQKIKVIERSTPSNRSFLGMDEIKNIKSTAKHEQIFNQAFINSQTLSSTTTKTSIESETSAQNEYMKSKEMDYNKIEFTRRNTSTPYKIREDEREYVNIRPMSSVILKDSPRRRSLPARLNNLATYGSPRTILNKKNVQGNQYTTEDMYIDDEFGSRLNYNLILLNDDIIILSDDESLPQTTEL
ncbi:hypothetical protein ALC62_08471 [Cyphomyrmex costatus]|uniref:Uncharacterized protein n=1 Tax=Cyphomyrmex costatus TaxID=456900 RepID=A0A195CJ94_9HYME|nr:hypothetical protein ALC62_08471 [Cyphomyrmex costatus]